MTNLEPELSVLRVYISEEIQVEFLLFNIEIWFCVVIEWIVQVSTFELLYTWFYSEINSQTFKIHCLKRAAYIEKLILNIHWNPVAERKIKKYFVNMTFLIVFLAVDKNLCEISINIGFRFRVPIVITNLFIN